MKSRCRVKHQAPKKRKQESANWSPQGDMQLCRLSGSIKVWNLISLLILLNPLISGSESETSELVNARYPYGMADDSLEEWAMLDPVASRFSPRTTNPMLRKDQYCV